MTEIYKILIQFVLWPILLSMMVYLWRDLSFRVRSIENRCINMEKDIVRIFALFER